MSETTSRDETPRPRASKVGMPLRTEQSRQTSASNIRVVGIDVGGQRKGMHAVALLGGRYRGRFACRDVDSMAGWCVGEMGASIVAVDAPCQWNRGEGGRPAERELMRRGIWCFSTPARQVAISHPKRYYDWMLHGEALYQALQLTYPIADSRLSRRKRQVIETFPHAITWHLRGGSANAKQKRTQRRQLLEQHGICTSDLTNIDWVDAALCALTAHWFASGAQMEHYGELQTGFIVVPSLASEDSVEGDRLRLVTEKLSRSKLPA